MKISLALGVLVALVACRPDAPPVTPASSTGDDATVATNDPAAGESDGMPADPDCVSFVETSVVDERFATGTTKLDASRDGEHYLAEPFEQAMGALKFAADNGHLEAQSLYGRVLFGARFTNQAPEVDEREDYVSAIAFLRIAAKAGDDHAASFLPDLTSDVPPTREPPYDGLPADWVHAAFQRADLWIDCHGLPKPRPDAE